VYAAPYFSLYAPPAVGVVLSMTLIGPAPTTNKDRAKPNSIINNHELGTWTCMNEIFRSIMDSQQCRTIALELFVADDVY
jgi:hypothetical protein